MCRVLILQTTRLKFQLKIINRAVVLSDKMWRAGKTPDRDNKVYTTGAKDEDGVAHCLL